MQAAHTPDDAALMAHGLSPPPHLPFFSLTAVQSDQPRLPTFLQLCNQTNLANFLYFARGNKTETTLWPLHHLAAEFGGLMMQVNIWVRT